jgi:hypothetical protein
MKGQHVNTLWRAIEILAAGAAAVKILHFDTEPTYLMLFIGWFGLAWFIVEGARLVSDLERKGYKGACE